MLLASLFGWQEHAACMPVAPQTEQFKHRDREPECEPTPVECFGTPFGCCGELPQQDEERVEALPVLWTGAQPAEEPASATDVEERG